MTMGNGKPMMITKQLARHEAIAALEAGHKFILKNHNTGWINEELGARISSQTAEALQADHLLKYGMSWAPEKEQAEVAAKKAKRDEKERAKQDAWLAELDAASSDNERRAVIARIINQSIFSPQL